MGIHIFKDWLHNQNGFKINIKEDKRTNISKQKLDINKKINIREELSWRYRMVIGN